MWLREYGSCVKDEVSLTVVSKSLLLFLEHQGSLGINPLPTILLVP